MTLSCGCEVEGSKGRFMAFLLRHQLFYLFDLLHTEAFVRAHQNGRTTCV